MTKKILFLLACSALLTLLWIPGLKYPVVSDSINYGLLGRSLWLHGTYMLNGVPYANHLPLHAFLSFPFTQLFGFHLGMHVTSLVGGFITLIGTFLLFLCHGERSRTMQDGHHPSTTLRVTPDTLRVTPYLVTLAVLFHPAFVLMAMLGSADLLFCGLFLLSLYFFLRAESDKRLYIAAFVFAGLATLTRYNGMPLFPLFLGWTLWKRPKDLKNSWFWSGLILGSAIFGAWLLRNMLVFGNPLHTGYTAELEQEGPNPFLTLLKNIRYYINPVHNVFPFFFVFALWGLWKFWNKQVFLLAAMIVGALISAIWWVQAIRFMFPAFVILLFFAILGIQDILCRMSFETRLFCHAEELGAGRRASRSTSTALLRMTATALILFAGITIQAGSFCVYTYGECNALLDRTIGILPKNMGLTTEGFYAWHLARNYINEHAEPEAVVLYEFPQESKGIFRDDLHVDNQKSSCPWYRITQTPKENENVVFKTEASPVTSVVKQECVE